MVVSNNCRPKTNWSPCGRREAQQDYYMVRPSPVYCGDYWSPKSDPDGVVRDRLSEQERLQFVADHQELIEEINAANPWSILDFGSGPGWLLREIDCDRKAAVETSPRASEELARHGIPVFAELSDIPSASYDFVLAYHVFEHLVDPIYHLNHIRRILSSGGVLILGTPDFGSPCAVRFGPNYRMLHDDTHCSLFTLESCSRMLRDHAFEILDVQFPFPARYATAETMARWNDTSKTSPPWPGNWITFIAMR